MAGDPVDYTKSFEQYSVWSEHSTISLQEVRFQSLLDTNTTCCIDHHLNDQLTKMVHLLFAITSYNI